MPASLLLPVVDQSQAGEARRRAVAWAVEQGCGPEDTGQLALVVAELARNLALHTTEGGALVLRLLRKNPYAFELLSLDGGPGKANFHACLSDGYSTSGTAGTGLGAVRRASTVFDFYSQPGVGTTLLSQFSTKPECISRKEGLGVINVPKTGETACGDSFGHRLMDKGRTRVMIADGLGHGPIAAEASQLAVAVLQGGDKQELPSLLEAMHAALRGTRGAAIAIAEIDPAAAIVRYVGVGNIAGVILSDAKPVHLVSMNGTVGSTLPRVREFTYPWAPHTLLVMNSDGVKTQWRLDRYTGLLERHPALAAGILFREFSRGTDDTTVVTLKTPYEHRM